MLLIYIFSTVKFRQLKNLMLVFSHSFLVTAFQKPEFWKRLKFTNLSKIQLENLGFYNKKENLFY